MAETAANKRLVVTALTELFIAGDASAADRYWAESYVQHNPRAPNGAGALRALVENSPPDFRYEIGMVVADGDIVMVHGRYHGLGPGPVIVADIFRVQGDRIVEHWDVAQKEITDTASGNPMFTAPAIPVTTPSA